MSTRLVAAITMMPSLISKTIHLNKHLVQRLLTLVMSAAHTGFLGFLPTASISSIKMIHGAFFFASVKQVTDTGCTDTDKHFHEIRTGNTEERNTRFTGNGFRKQCLTGSRRAAPEAHLSGFCAPELEIFLRCLPGNLQSPARLFFFLLQDRQHLQM